MDNNNDNESRTSTVRLWLKELIKKINVYFGRSLITGAAFIVEIPDYLDDKVDNQE
jgi:hypothetical protein